MSDFNSQQELFKYLIDGGSVQHFSGSVARFEDGELIERAPGHVKILSYRSYINYEDFSVCEEKKWYDSSNFPMLCKVWEYDITDYKIAVIESVGPLDDEDGSLYYRDDTGLLWMNALPARLVDVDRFIYKGNV